MDSIRLHYRADDYHGFEKFVHAKPEYFQVTEYPVAEMMGTTPEGWAEDFVDLSNSEMWYQQNRRVVQPGDLMVAGTAVYLFMSAQEHPSAVILPHWPKLAILALEPTLSQAILAAINYHQ